MLAEYVSANMVDFILCGIMNIKEKTIDERINDLTVQFQLLLAKEIERNKELDKERAERKEREAKWEAKLEKEREQREKELAERKEREESERVQREAERVQREAERVQRDKEQAERDKERAEAEEAYRKRMDKQFGQFTNSYGREAEVLFQRSIKRTGLVANIQFDTVYCNVQSTRKSREYDMVLVNGKYVALVEVKRSATLEDLENLVEVQAKAFRDEMKLYKDKKLICVLAFFQCDDKVFIEAKKKGVCIIFKNGFHIKQSFEGFKEF